MRKLKLVAAVLLGFVSSATAVAAGWLCNCKFRSNTAQQ